MLTFAIGDIHGHYDKLYRLLVKCKAYAGSAKYRLVFLGDYIDRGEDSRSVLELLKELHQGQSGQMDVICLLGNHEEMLITSFDDPVISREWLKNGGIETLDSYSDVGGMRLLEQHAAWLGGLPIQFDDGLRLFVHAGVNPSTPLDAQTRSDLLWIREPFLSFEGKLDRLIVHGHTPARSGPEVRPHRVNLDTGAVYGGSLTSGIFNCYQAMPLGFLSV